MRYILVLLCCTSLALADFSIEIDGPATVTAKLDENGKFVGFKVSVSKKGCKCGEGCKCGGKKEVSMDTFTQSVLRAARADAGTTKEMSDSAALVYEALSKKALTDPVTSWHDFHNAGFSDPKLLLVLKGARASVLKELVGLDNSHAGMQSSKEIREKASQIFQKSSVALKQLFAE